MPDGINSTSFFDALALPGRTHTELLATRTTGGTATVYRRGRGVGGSSAVNALAALRGDAALYRRWGWTDADEMFARIELPAEAADPAELGPVDQALLAADPRAERLLLTRRAGRRVTSAEAYLWPVLDRPNLTVRSDCGVERVLFKKRLAVGVRLLDGSEIDADRVVLAAGAIHTPGILLRSGVDTAGVGAGLQDHPSAAITLVLRDHVVQDVHGLPLGSMIQTLAGQDRIQVLPMSHLGPQPEAARLGVLLLGLMTPRGADGSVGIDIDGNLKVDFALLRDQHDVAALVAAVRMAQQVLAHQAFTSIVEAAFIDAVGTPIDALTDDATVAAWVVANCADYVHASSTCAMGVTVDADGAFRGYENLMVCDASIFPSIPDVNTHLPTTMAAERLSARWIADRRSC